MDAWLKPAIHGLLATLALPKVGLPAIFLISLISATFLPLGSEPAVFAYVKIAPHMFWPAIVVATIGNTIGGIITFLMGAWAKTAYEAWSKKRNAGPLPDDEPPKAAGTRHAATAAAPPGGRWHELTARWFERFGPPALLLSWLPAVGDPLCAVAGWLKLSFWPCVVYMAIGKCLRYIILTTALLHTWPWVSHWLAHL